MANFKYTALDQNGVEKTGIIAADSKMAAAEMVRAQGLLLRECVETSKSAKPTGAKEVRKKGDKKKAARQIFLNRSRVFHSSPTSALSVSRR